MPSISDTPWLIPENSLDAIFRGANLGGQIFQNQQLRRSNDTAEQYRQSQEEVMRAEEARKAQEATIRFQGLQGLKAEVERLTSADMPPEDALKTALPKYLADITYGAPGALPQYTLGSDRNDIAQLRTDNQNAQAIQRDETRRTLGEMQDQSRKDKLEQDDRHFQDKLNSFYDKLDVEAAKPDRKNDINFREYMNKAAVIRTDKVLTSEQKLARLSQLRDVYKSIEAGNPPPEVKEPDKVDEELKKIDDQIAEQNIKIATEDRPFIHYGKDARLIKIDDLEEKKKKLIAEFKKPDKSAKAAPAESSEKQQMVAEATRLSAENPTLSKDEIKKMVLSKFGKGRQTPARSSEPLHQFPELDTGPFSGMSQY